MVPQKHHKHTQGIFRGLEILEKAANERNANCAAITQLNTNSAS